MYCIIVTKPLVKVNRNGIVSDQTMLTAADHAMLEPGDKWVEIQEYIISRAFITKARAERWAYRHGGIEEHDAQLVDAQLVARGMKGEFDFFQRHGKFELRETSQYPARTQLLLLDLGARELPAEPAQKKAKQTALAEIARQHAMEREQGQERMNSMLGQTSPYWTGTGDAPF